MPDAPQQSHKLDSPFAKQRDALQEVVVIAEQLAELHAAGWLHRELADTEIAIPLQIDRDRLVEIGGPLCDVERTPPEARQDRQFSVPARIEEARREFLRLGLLTAPERIDIYQLGVLICRRITGRSIRSFLSSPRVASSVPQPLRDLIEQCTGYDESNAFKSASDIVKACHEVLSQLSDSAGNLSSVTSETSNGTAAGTVQIKQELPFDKLGHFEISEVIGRGGMGTVYRATDPSLRREVAIKVMSPLLSSDPAFIERFQAEAAAAAKLAHPNIVPIHFIGEDDGRYYYAMQFIAGESLADRLYRSPHFTTSEILAIIEPLLHGLAAAHRRGLIHRDIKPGNVLIDSETGRVMLTDFGLARSIEDATRSDDQNLVMGTPGYMSPEQACGETPDARTDLYSIGALLDELLTGQTPQGLPRSTSQFQQSGQGIREASLPEAELERLHRPALTSIVSRLLEDRPEDRYQTVDELQLDIGHVLTVSNRDSDGDGTRPLSERSAIANRSRTQSSGRRLARWVLPTLGSVALVVMIAIATKQDTPGSTAPSMPLVAHTDSIMALQFTPDGKYLISAGGRSSSLKDAGDTSLRLWQTADGRLVNRSQPLPARATQLAVIGDRVVAFGSTRENAGFHVVWDFDTSMPSGTLGTVSFTDAFAVQLDVATTTGGTGRTLACGRDGVFEVDLPQEGWRAKLTLMFEAQFVVRGVAHAAGTDQTAAFVVVAIEHRAGVNDIQHQLVTVFPDTGEESKPVTAPGPINALALSDDGRTCAIRCTIIETDGRAFDVVEVRDWPSGKLRHSFSPFAAASRALAMSADGRLILTVGSSLTDTASNQPQAAVLLNAKSGKHITSLRPGSRALTMVALSPVKPLAAIGDVDGNVTFFRIKPSR